MIKPLLIEIGTEELPAIPFLKELPNIEKKWSDILEKNSLLCEFEFFYTPRRLIFWHREFKAKQEDRFEEFFGAPVEIAYKDGVPSSALLSFAKKIGIEPEQVGVAKKDNKNVIYFKKEILAKNTTQILGSMVDEFLKSLNFGKSMRWGSNEESFIRPIRWVLALFGDEKIEFQTFGVKSSNITYPHRSIGFEPFSVSFAGDYFCKIDKNGVVLYQNERERKILEEFEILEKEYGFEIERDSELLAEVVAITENPKVLIGGFDERFLRVPNEAIVASMKTNQRYFPVFKDGKLQNKFAVITDAIALNYEKIIGGNEKVLRARLSDALFFYENDLARGLSFEGLKEVMYIDGLGSMFDKTLREREISSKLFELYKQNLLDELQVEEAKARSLLNHAVMLSKADLLSEMVYEFTELQGLMGKYYALASGEELCVATALSEQYLPNSESSPLPSSIFSSIVALSYRLDTLFALYSIGKIPSGAKDPYGLRRAANGVIKIIISLNLPFNLAEILKLLSKGYRDFNVKQLEDFIQDRLYQIFDANPSIIKAVLESGERDLCTISKKVNALKTISLGDDFKDVFVTFKRVANIVKDFDSSKNLNVESALFENQYESDLFNSFIEINGKTYDTFEEQLDALFGLKPKIDLFFDNVMVNVENEALKNNRKNLIGSIYMAFKSIADIKEISV